MGSDYQRFLRVCKGDGTWEIKELLQSMSCKAKEVEYLLKLVK